MTTLEATEANEATQVSDLQNTQPHGHEVSPPVSPSEILNNAATEAGTELKGPLFRDEKIAFYFKGKKDPETKEIIPGSKRATVNLVVPVLTFDGLVEKLFSGTDQVKNYIVEQVNNAVKEGAKAQVYDTEKPVNKQSELDIHQLTIEHLASIPPSERAGTGISEEMWNTFEEDYISTMHQLDPAYDLERIKKAAKLFVTKFKDVKGDKNVLTFLQGRLSLWGGSTKNSEELAPVFEFLDGKLDTLLKKDQVDMMASL